MREGATKQSIAEAIQRTTEERKQQGGEAPAVARLEDLAKEAGGLETRLNLLAAKAADWLAVNSANAEISQKAGRFAQDLWAVETERARRHLENKAELFGYQAIKGDLEQLNPTFVVQNLSGTIERKNIFQSVPASSGIREQVYFYDASQSQFRTWNNLVEIGGYWFDQSQIRETLGGNSALRAFSGRREDPQKPNEYVSSGTFVMPVRQGYWLNQAENRLVPFATQNPLCLEMPFNKKAELEKALSSQPPEIIPIPKPTTSPEELAPRTQLSSNEQPAPSVETIKKETLSKIKVFEVAAATDVGRQRKGNEDNFIAWSAEKMANLNGIDAISLIADGMGGAEAGEVASHDTLAKVSQKVWETNWQSITDPNEVADKLAEIIYTVNLEILSQRKAAGNDMGTTLSGVVTIKGIPYAVNVGDSRTYFFDEVKGSMEPLTTDHSLVGVLATRGDLAPEYVRVHPQRNFILRNIGDKEYSDSKRPANEEEKKKGLADTQGMIKEKSAARNLVDVQPLALKGRKGYFVSATDGGWEMLTEEHMAKVLAQLNSDARKPTSQELAQRLTKEANDFNDGYDLAAKKAEQDYLAISDSEKDKKEEAKETWEEYKSAADQRRNQGGEDNITFCISQVEG